MPKTVGPLPKTVGPLRKTVGPLRGWRLCLAVMVGLSALSASAQAEPLAVRVANLSKPTLCAEDDNVDLRLYGSAKQFRIAAKPPAFMGLIVRDQTAPDFTDCTIKDAPPDPGSVIDQIVLYEDAIYRLVGFRKTGGFWRKAEVDVSVGNTRLTHLELLQWQVKQRGEFYEFLVLYPSDGYWRLRLLPPDPLSATAYGTSFLVGPVMQNTRPFVALKSVRFEPALRRFVLGFKQGGEGSLTLAELSPAQVAVDVDLSGLRMNGLPFMAMRSMFVREDNADSAVVSVKSPRSQQWHSAPVMRYRGGLASTVWLGRVAPSRHNTSAPDMQVDGFVR
jgi:hypothetical protein